MRRRSTFLMWREGESGDQTPPLLREPIRPFVESNAAVRHHVLPSDLESGAFRRNILHQIEVRNGSAALARPTAFPPRMHPVRRGFREQHAVRKDGYRGAVVDELQRLKRGDKFHAVVGGLSFSAENSRLATPLMMIAPQPPRPGFG